MLYPLSYGRLINGKPSVIPEPARRGSRRIGEPQDRQLPPRSVTRGATSRGPNPVQCLAPSGGTVFEFHGRVNRPTSDSGFSLIEIFIVCALVAGLAALAVPSVEAARDGSELRTAGNNVAAKMQEARLNSLKRNRATWLLLTVADGTVRVQTTDNLGAVVDVGSTDRLPTRVTIVTGGTTQQVMFDALGRPTNAAGVLTQQAVLLRHTRNLLTRTATATTTGRVTVQ